MNKIFFFRIGLLCAVLFAFFTFLVNKDLLIAFDFDITVKLQDNLSRRLDTFFSTFSLLGSVEITTLVLLVLVAFNRKVESAGVLVLYVLSLVVELFGKIMVEHPGPPAMFHRFDIPITFPSFYVHPGSSFPSGHTTRTAFLAVLIFYMIWNSKKINKGLKILISFVLLFIVLTMYISRVYLGEHWSTDVIGGFLLGTAFASLSVRFLK